MAEPIILADADNTLWDTDATFVNAQLGLLSIVEQATSKRCTEEDRLGFVRRYDQAIAAIHHAHLKYPPPLLVFALERAFMGADPATAAEQVVRGKTTSKLAQSQIDDAVENYLHILGSIPDLLPAVMNGLKRLHDAGMRPYILTEGKIEKQKKLLEHHALTEFVSGIFELTKSQAQFERLRQRFAPAEVITIGDQIDRDILPAKAAGCLAVLVPGRFRPFWHKPEQETEADFVASNFETGVEWILRRQRP